MGTPYAAATRAPFFSPRRVPSRSPPAMAGPSWTYESICDVQAGAHVQRTVLRASNSATYIDEFVEVLTRGTHSPHTLDLSYNALGDEPIGMLAQAIANENCSLHTLDLHGNDAADVGAGALAKGVASETCSLNTLYLWNNHVGNDGARALAKAIEEPTCSLHTLDLSYNEVGDEGARALVQALQSETCTLHTLDLRWNRAGDDCARDVSDALALSRARRRRRYHGMLRAIVRFLILRQRACEVVFHPTRLRREGVFDAISNFDR